MGLQFVIGKTAGRFREARLQSERLCNLFLGGALPIDPTTPPKDGEHRACGFPGQIRTQPVLALQLRSQHAVSRLVLVTLAEDSLHNLEDAYAGCGV